MSVATFLAATAESQHRKKPFSHKRKSKVRQPRVFSDGAVEEGGTSVPNSVAGKFAGTLSEPFRVAFREAKVYK